MKTVVGISGASGVIYGVRLLEVLKGEKLLVVSEHGWEIMREETEYTKDDILKLAHIYKNDDFYSPLASGSFLFDSLVICPCSVSTMSKIAVGIQDTLMTRLASVALKEKRKCILVVRETPLSTIALENMARLSSHGATILPAMPAFYHHPTHVSDMVDFVVGKILDSLGVENELFERWGATRAP
jgi:4-hydroxy-3-polyprenylbenzoate decarboxylase